MTDRTIKILSRLLGPFWPLTVLTIVTLVVAGCAGPKAGPGGKEPPPEAPTEIFSPGDAIEIEFPDLPNADPSTRLIKTQVKDDGTITLPLIGPVDAKDKTSRELETIIRTNYVDAFYKRLTVIVRAGDRVYYVGGQVKLPGRQLYISDVTVTKGIQAAGDFTDFADRKSVKLIRKTGRIVTVNCIKASKDPRLDPKVYPGDRIEVPQSWY